MISFSTSNLLCCFLLIYTPRNRTSRARILGLIDFSSYIFLTPESWIFSAPEINLDNHHESFKRTIWTDLALNLTHDHRVQENVEWISFSTAAKWFFIWIFPFQFSSLFVKDPKAFADFMMLAFLSCISCSKISPKYARWMINSSSFIQAKIIHLTLNFKK